MTIKRAELVVPTLPRESMHVPELGGDVIVQGLKLSARLELHDQLKVDPQLMVSKLLAITVLDADEAPLMNESEWDVWGGIHQSRVFEIFTKSRLLSGLDQDASEKK